MKWKITRTKEPNLGEKLSHLNGAVGEGSIAQNLLEQDNQMIRDAIATLKDMTQIGQQTLTQLEEQGQQLKKVDHSINDIRRDNYHNKQQLRQVKSLFGGLINRITGCFHREIKDEWPEEQSKKNKHKHPSSKKNDDFISYSSGQTPLFDIYKKNEQGLTQVDNLTLGLQDLAQHMNTEIDFQTDQLDRIFANADKALQEIRKNKKTANETY